MCWNNVEPSPDGTGALAQTVAPSAPTSRVGAPDVERAGQAASPRALAALGAWPCPRAHRLALVVTAEGGKLRLEVVDAVAVAPVESYPNRALSRDAAIIRRLWGST